MQMDIRFPGGKKVDAVYKGFTVKTDQPRGEGGDGSAPEPFDLFLASIGTCAGIYALSFCQARGVISPPPYKDFAKELASLMTRARRDFRGRRDVRRNRQGNATCTLYWVPDPAAAVVELAEEKRKRA